MQLEKPWPAAPVPNSPARSHTRHTAKTKDPPGRMRDHILPAAMSPAIMPTSPAAQHSQKSPGGRCTPSSCPYSPFRLRLQARLVLGQDAVLCPALSPLLRHGVDRPLDIRRTQHRIFSEIGNGGVASVARSKWFLTCNATDSARGASSQRRDFTRTQRAHCCRQCQPR